MILSSSAFADGGMIPMKHTGFGEDVSPDLSIAEAPDGTVTYAIIMDDPDVPFCRRFNHWIAWNIPKVNTIPEALPAGARIHEPVHACQGMAWGRNRYRGPKQPFFIRREHRYVFTVFALDCELDLPERANRALLLHAMDGHILSEAAICGRFRRGC